MSAALRAAANDWSGALLFALGFAHELLKTREVGHLEVATLAAQQTDGGKPTQLARNRLAMCADAIGNIGKGWSRGQQSLPVLTLSERAFELSDQSIVHRNRSIENMAR